MIFYKYNFLEKIEFNFKGIVHPKMKIMSLSTHPHVVSKPQDFPSSSEHKLKYF